MKVTTYFLGWKYVILDFVWFIYHVDYDFGMLRCDLLLVMHVKAVDGGDSGGRYGGQLKGEESYQVKSLLTRFGIFSRVHN
ncbi:hypothetical protein Leryth_011156 [Lithospermum erythrorhizon]|nr:hypothetical protein Leryth_011156 [Lithospermum erythrorhizon]